MPLACGCLHLVGTVVRTSGIYAAGKMEGEGRAVEWYNKTLGSSTYKEKVKPVVDKALGGSLRLFIQKVYEGSYFTRNEEVVLYVHANLPNGSTLEQMNELIKRWRFI